MKYGYIYKTTHKKTKRVYIGQRKGEFRPSYFGSGIHIRRAVDKYGEDEFKLEVVVVAKSKKQLDSLEKKYIKDYRKMLGRNKVMNMADGGEGTTGVIPSKKTRKLLSLAKQGKPSPRKGVVLSKSTRLKQSIAHSGKILSQAHKDNIGKTLRSIKIKPWVKLAIARSVRTRRRNALKRGYYFTPEAVKNMTNAARERFKLTINV